MEIDLNEHGECRSLLIEASGGRKVVLSGAEASPDPIKLAKFQWSTISATFEKFTGSLSEAETQPDPDGDQLLIDFRRLVYDATELFDTYCQLLPSQLKVEGKKDKEIVRNYKITAKRLRDECSKLCNRFKHNGAEIKFLWAESPTNGLGSGLVDQSQKMTVAARAMADKKTVGHLS